MKKRLLALTLCVSVLASGLVGCGKKEDTSTSQTVADKAEAGTVAVEEKAVELVDPKTAGLHSMFPLKEPVTLDYYININGAMSATMETYADVEFFKELEKMTNVHINWNHNTSNENFALMIASGNLPDLINWQLGSAAGGVQALVEDEVIVDLTQLLPEYAPNYYAWMKANPEEDKAFKLDDGRYYHFVNFNADWDNMDIVNFKILGPQIRKDWLDKAGMEMPTSTDELYEVLKAFKEGDMNGNGDPEDEIPMVVVGSDKGLNETMYSLAGSWGTRNDYHLQDGEIVYGPITDNYREFLVYMRKLYSEGLINGDFAVNQQAFDFMRQDRAGFAFSAMGSGLIATREMLMDKNPEYEYVSVPWLTGPEGFQSNTIDLNVNPRSTAITTSCENPEIAAAWLDYVYSYAGSLNSTFGIEGRSYEMIDGKPVIMDAVKQNDKGWSEEQSISRWMIGSINYPNARDKNFYEQINLNEDYKVEIQDNWKLAKDDIIIPPVVMTTDESATFSGIMADIKTYASECTLKFITGDMDLDTEWDTYKANIENMNLAEAMACKAAAMERYKNR